MNSCRTTGLFFSVDMEAKAVWIEFIVYASSLVSKYGDVLAEKTGVVIISLMYRASPRTPYRFSWDGVALIGMYIGSIVALYWLG